jgi:hypothetical protein
MGGRREGSGAGGGGGGGGGDSIETAAGWASGYRSSCGSLVDGTSEQKWLVVAGICSFPARRFGLCRPTLSLFRSLSPGHEPRWCTFCCHPPRTPSTACCHTPVLQLRTRPPHAPSVVIAAMLVVDEPSTPR